MALPWVGHRELRSRGTIGGSLAHADPAAELPAVACCAEATFEITGPDGTREVAARDFFAGAMTTAVGPAEILTAVRFPVAEDGDGFGFAEVARRHGDFALAGVAVRVRRGSRSNGIGSGVEACLTAFGVSDRPVTADVTEALTAALSGVGRGARAGAGGAGAGAGAGEEAALASALIEPMVTLAGDLVDTSGDPHGSPAYRRRLVTHLAATQIACAYQRSGKPLPASDP
jgi:carbon-monoxide dehydrogenase medium subunit